MQFPFAIELRNKIIATLVEAKIRGVNHKVIESVLRKQDLTRQLQSTVLLLE